MSEQVHPTSLCAPGTLGAGASVGAFAHVHAGAVVGEQCELAEHVVVAGGAVLGRNVRVGSNVRVGDGVQVGDDVVIEAGVAFAEQIGPPRRRAGETDRGTAIGMGAGLGANCTIAPGVQVGRRARVAPGAVVTKDVPPNALVSGNPAQIVGYVDRERSGSGPVPRTRTRDDRGRVASSVDGVVVIPLARAEDLRGSLVAADFDGLPFVPRRFFTVYDVPSTDTRGEHAHRRCHQLLICTRGSVRAVVDDGTEVDEILLDRPDIGLYMPPMTWGTQYRYAVGTSLLVLASDPYDPGDYIRDHDEFLAEVARRSGRAS